MMRRALLFGVPLLAAVVGAQLLRAERLPADGACLSAGRPPRTRPDYAGVTIPPNLAPLTFVVEEPARRCALRVSGPNGSPLEVTTRGPAVRIPMDPWRRLLEANRGRELRFDLYAADEQGRWTRFDAFTNRVADEEVDPILVYRSIGPGYNLCRELAITQRDLESYSERPLISNGATDNNCINCHTFYMNRPDTFLFHVRDSRRDGRGPSMVVVRDGKARRVDMRKAGCPGPAAMSSWHPNGEWLAFSTNAFRQFYHMAGAEARDAVDLKSGVYVYSFDTGRVVEAPQLDRLDRLETFPTWAPDGRWLYLSSAPTLAGELPQAFKVSRRIRYDLVRVSFDPATGKLGEPEPVVSAASVGKSIVEPRVSPDGRSVLVAMCNASTFPTFQPDSDVYQVDLTKPGFPHRRLDPDPEPQRDTWPSWSSNGRWIAFSRKKGIDLLSRAYLRHIDADGVVSKAFVIPQGDPTYYDRCTHNYNLPELAKGFVRISPRVLADAARAETAD